MAHALNKVWIHTVWTTKHRSPVLKQEIEEDLYRFIKVQFEELDCPARIVNGMPDHIHCLFMLHPTRSIAEVIKQVKGSSSRYINTENLVAGGFSWQVGYGAFSVSYGILDKIYYYIRNQKKHHAANRKDPIEW